MSGRFMLIINKCFVVVMWVVVGYFGVLFFSNWRNNNWNSEFIRKGGNVDDWCKIVLWLLLLGE